MGRKGPLVGASFRPTNTAESQQASQTPIYALRIQAGTERMNPTRTCALRTRLRDVNIEYSMLVKSKPEEGNSVRMAQLRGERAALMAMLSGERASLSVTSNQTPLNAVTQRSA